MDIVKHLAGRLEKYLLGRRPCLVAGFSGGRDSVALLYGLWLWQRQLAAAEKRGFCLAAAHFDHGLRGAESDGDREFCREFCASLAIEFCCRRGEGLLDTPDQENRARKLRYGWLEEVCQEREAAGFGPVWLLTAHHREDQAETVLLHLLRGSGGAGLAAMRERRGRLLRPFLGVGREDIEAFLRLHNLHWREDSSNAGDDYTRNRLRHRVMPRLKELNPNAAAALANAAEIAAAEEDFLAAAARERLEAAVAAGRATLTDGAAAYMLTEFEREHLAIKRRIIRELWRRTLGLSAAEPGGLSFEQTKRVLHLPLHRELHLAGGVVVRKNHGWLRFFRLSEAEMARRRQKSRSGQQNHPKNCRLNIKEE